MSGRQTRCIKRFHVNLKWLSKIQPTIEGTWKMQLIGSSISGPLCLKSESYLPHLEWISWYLNYKMKDISWSWRISAVFLKITREAGKNGPKVGQGRNFENNSFSGWGGFRSSMIFLSWRRFVGDVITSDHQFSSITFKFSHISQSLENSLDISRLPFFNVKFNPLTEYVRQND